MGDRASAPTLGSKCRDLPGRPGEARAVGPGGQGGGLGEADKKQKRRGVRARNWTEEAYGARRLEAYGARRLERERV